MSVEPSEPSRKPEIRASDAERQEVVERLSEHAASGRLTLDELEERIGLAFAAKTQAELAELTADLPESSAHRPSRLQPTRRVFSMMGAAEKTGRWRVGERLTAIAFMGGNDLDLRSAELDGDDVTIVAVSVMGGMDIYLPDTIEVEVGGFALMGGNGERGSTRPPRPGAPRVRILAYSLMGGTDVWRLPEEARGVSLKQAKKLAKRAR